MLEIRYAHQYDCDVLIVGGGPGGSALAFHLAQAGVKTIVLEAQSFPRDKVCGDGVSPIALAELAKLGITDWEHFGKANEIKRVGLFIEEDQVTVPLSKTKQSPFHARIIPRLQLDGWICEAAKGKGARYLEDTRLVSYVISEHLVRAEIKQDRVTRSLKAKMIVGADGSSSTVARIFHRTKPSPAFQLLGLRAYYEDVQGPTDRVDVFFSKSNFPGIYWMFPIGERGANIGLAMVAKTVPKNDHHVKELLDNHIRTNKCIAARIGQGHQTGKVLGWPLKFHNPQIPITDARLLLVGDAAGLINPLSGDGIQYAMLSARWAAECIIPNVARNDYSATAMQNYKNTVDRHLAYDFALSNLLIQFGKNKALTPIGLQIMRVMIERAKVDAAYADTIAGIFEGSYPSYKALNLSFILKSVLQGGLTFGQDAASGLLQGPQHWIGQGQEASAIANNMFRLVLQDPQGHSSWLKEMISNTAKVSSHLLGYLRDR